MSLSSLIGLLNGHFPTLTIDAAVFQQAQLNVSAAFDTTLRNAFGSSSAPTLTISQPIPDTSGMQVSFPAQIGTRLFQSKGATVTITVDASNAATLLIVIPMPADWKWADTFITMTEYPFDGTAIVWTDPEFVAASEAVTGFQYAGSSWALSAGLNFLSSIDSPVIEQVGSLFGLTTDALFASGTVDPSVIQLSPSSGTGIVLYPLLDLSIALADGSFVVGSGRFQFSIGTPSFGLSIGAPGALPPSQTPGLSDEQYVQFLLEGTLAFSGFTYDVQLALLNGSSMYQLNIVPVPGRELTFTDLVPLAGTNLTSSIPRAFEQLFSSIGLLQFAVNLNHSSMTSLLLVIGTDDSWRVIEDLTVKQVSMAVNITSPLASPSHAIYFQGVCDFLTTTINGEFDVMIAADLSTIEMSFVGTVKPLELLDALVGQDVFPVTFADGFVLTDFVIDVNRAASGYSLSVDSQAETAITVLGEPLTASVSFDYSKAAGSSSYAFAGGVTIANNRFQFTADTDSFSASWQAIGSDTITLADILTDLGFDTGTGLDFLTLSVSGVSLTYDYGTSLTLQILDTIDLTDLPLIGNVLPPTEQLSIQNLTFLIAFAQGAPAAGGHAIQSVSLSTTLVAGTDSSPLSFTLYQKPSTDALVLRSPRNGSAATNPETPEAAAGSVHWIQVRKAFGPLNVSAVGIGMSGSKLEIVVGAQLQTDDLSISLQNAGVIIALDAAYDPQFVISGVGIEYSHGDVEAGGSFTSVPSPPPDVDYEYAGTLLLSAGNFSIDAIGSYASMNGTTSLFAFARLDEAFGGPPYFFITGIVAGFGYNSSLTLPSLSAVASFPLVSGITTPSALGSQNPTPLDVLNTLMGTSGGTAWVTSKIGSDWIGAGLRFTSFEMVQSIATVFITLAQTFEVTLIGLSAASFPKDAADPVAHVEMALDATFDPSAGVLSLGAELTPQSYLFEPACQLTGQFAFVVWYAGLDAGQFVLSLGGYNPYFVPPSEYPSVARLGLNWKVDDNLQLTGQSYFALTPAAFMAGGSLRADFNDGSIHAWFLADVNFLIQWAPFHYEADTTVSVGVSFQLDVAFVHQTITASVGVAASFWGPAFGGTATVDLDIVSFNIDFGAPRPVLADVMDWTSFQSAFLTSTDPAVNAAAGLTAVGGSTNTTSSTSINMAAASPAWVLDPQNAEITLGSAFPLTAAYYNGGTDNLIGNPISFGIAPMGIDDGNLSSALMIGVQREGVPYSNDSLVTGLVTSSIPKALWQNDAPTLSSDTTIDDSPVGLTLSYQPSLTPANFTVDADQLLYERDTAPPVSPWGATSEQTVTDDPQQAFLDLGSMNAPNPQRNSILQALAQNGFQIYPQVSAAQFAANAATLLQAAPQLSTWTGLPS